LGGFATSRKVGGKVGGMNKRKKFTFSHSREVKKKTPDYRAGVLSSEKERKGGRRSSKGGGVQKKPCGRDWTYIENKKKSLLESVARKKNKKKNTANVKLRNPKLKNS